jgi:hypothetical protein
MVSVFVFSKSTSIWVQNISIKISQIGPKTFRYRCWSVQRHWGRNVWRHWGLGAEKVKTLRTQNAVTEMSWIRSVLLPKCPVTEENPVFMKVCCIILLFIFVRECWLCGPVLYAKQYLAYFHSFQIDDSRADTWTAVKTARPVFVSGIEVLSRNEKQLVVLSYKLVHTAN